MKSHIKEILEKMKGDEYPRLNIDLVVKLTNESERGAILIGVGKIEEHLENLIIRLFPSPDKNYRKRLLNYPGPLSSFSGKIELLYAFRIIDKRLYDSLNTLRILRNQAAHSSDLFSLQNAKEQLDEIYNFEDRMSGAIHKLAFDNLIRFKKSIIKKGLEEEGLLGGQDIDELWNERVPNPETDQHIQAQLTIWKLSYGLTFLCLKIEAITDDYTSLISTDRIWLDYRDNSSASGITSGSS